MLVTGASGFLGSHVVCALLKKGNRVRAMKRADTDLRQFRFILRQYAGEQASEWESRISWTAGDVTDIGQLDELLKGEDFVYHCAALVSFNGNRGELFRINADGTANVVNACLRNGIKKLIYASSTAALGRSDDAGIIDESNQWVPSPHNTVYAQSKHQAELEVWRGMEEGLEAVIVNPGIILGAGDWSKGSCRLFDRVARGLKFYTEGINGFVGAEDVAGIMISLADSEIHSKRFLLISENMSYKELFESMALEMRVKAPFIPIRPIWKNLLTLLLQFRSVLYPGAGITAETFRSSLNQYRYDASKIKKLGYEFTPLKEVIRHAAGAYLASGGKI